MMINEKILIEIKHEGIIYLVQIDSKHDMLFEDEGRWEADVDYLSSNGLKRNSEAPYPYFTVWGDLDKEGCPTTNEIHGLVNYENYDARLTTSDIRVLSDNV